ncbi:hypothetical protein F8227_16360 [Brevibacterium linens ATCC 9172]|nr:hypothetical protein F8227_16360 [Brevibacterium linens ATCC 9172]
MEFRHTTIEAQDTPLNQDHWSILWCPSPSVSVALVPSIKRSLTFKRSLLSVKRGREYGVVDHDISALRLDRQKSASRGRAVRGRAGGGRAGGGRADGRRPGGRRSGERTPPVRRRAVRAGRRRSVRRR